MIVSDSLDRRGEFEKEVVVICNRKN